MVVMRVLTPIISTSNALMYLEPGYSSEKWTRT